MAEKPEETWILKYGIIIVRKDLFFLIKRKKKKEKSKFTSSNIHVFP